MGRDMAVIKGNCTINCKSDSRGCWHGSNGQECSVRRIFTSGKFLIENRAGYVRAAAPAELIFTEEEKIKYKDRDLEATNLDIEAEMERNILRWRIEHNSHKINW